ncbi:bifunctional metallophosphatase/5'-nucleotidase [Alkalicoccus urumqiensis]|uniref:Bifunctional metallophosphatase/5'-nucleotidase n=1 Tax=Alkalicoccus urumqiensis TaxID=1548213 RepID=A0A2P6MH29_ALKUR|nr:bifunctional UDP-sugar hydrolase/5'-nucleotidase [Alkalicoccus urumqiensis]PRO65540.1 bifunctional metallophosphatase/5'-nucleotidase [Alkalicoccus urumqiensis]
MRQLTILHTNDLHSELDQWPAVVKRVKERRDRAPGEVLLFDLGDHSDRVHPITEGLMGRGNVELLNDLQVDGVTIGNNEGITFAKEDLDHLYDEAAFPVLLANLRAADGTFPSWAERYRIYTLEDGTRLGVFGLTFPFYTFYQELGWNIIDPMETAEEVIKDIDADMIICLSHLGLRLDEELAERFPQIHLCLGAHTHHVIHGGKQVNQTWIHQCGRSGSHIGEVCLTRRNNDWKIDHIYTHEIDPHHRDAGTEQKLMQLEAASEAALEERVAVLEEPMDVSWYETSRLLRITADGLRGWTESDVAMVNAGLLLQGLPSGNVTRKHLHEICPHPINPAALTVTGSELLHIMREAESDAMVHYRLKGFGFRGKVLGWTLFQGEDGAVDKNKVEESAVYRLAVPDLFTFSHLYPLLTEKRPVHYYMPEFFRDILAWKLAEREESHL